MNNNKLLVILVLILTTLFVLTFVKNASQSEQFTNYDFNELIIRGSDGPQGESGPVGPPGLPGPSCKNILQYIEKRGHLTLDASNTNVMGKTQLELNGNPNFQNSPALFTRLKINDTNGTFPIMVGNTESDSSFYIKHDTSGKTKLKLRGDLSIDGNINFSNQTKNSDASMLFYSLMPVGIIAAYGNSGTMMPQGWAICNGQTVDGFITPDLRNKFIMGTDNLATSGDSNDDEFGPDKNKTKDGLLTLIPDNLPAHKHRISEGGNHSHEITVSEFGDHSHGISINGSGERGESNSVVLNGSQGGPSIVRTGLSGGHNHTFSIDDNGAHSHTINEVGQSLPINIMPPYMSMVYIIKYK